MRGGPDRLYMIAQRGVTSGVMADQIDPNRENIKIPWMVQREELEYGADSSFVQRTLCVAMELLDTTHLPKRIDVERGFELGLRAAQELGAIADVVAELRRSQAEVRGRIESGALNLDHLPRTPNLRGRVDQALAHLRNVQLAAIELAELFYPRPRRNLPWAATLAAAVKRALEGDSFLPVLDRSIEVLKSVANYRNAMVHPDAMKWVRHHDYELTANGLLLAPTIEIAHPDTPQERTDTASFLDDQIDRISAIFEIFLAVFCDRNGEVLGPIFEAHVRELPEDGRRNGSRFTWETVLKEGVNLPVGSAAKADPPDRA